MDSNEILNYLKPLSKPLFNSIKNSDYNNKKSELELFNQRYRSPGNQNPFQFLKNSHPYLPNEDGQWDEHNEMVKDLHDKIDQLSTNKSAIDKIDENEKEFLNSRLKMFGSFVLFIFGTVFMADPTLNLFGLAVASGSIATLFATIPFLAPLIATAYFYSKQSKIIEKNNSELEKIKTQDSTSLFGPVAQENILQEISKLILEIDRKKANYYPSEYQESYFHHPLAIRLQGRRRVGEDFIEPTSRDQIQPHRNIFEFPVKDFDSKTETVEGYTRIMERLKLLGQQPVEPDTGPAIRQRYQNQKRRRAESPDGWGGGASLGRS